jgi:hypothetical protein
MEIFGDVVMFLLEVVVGSIFDEFLVTSEWTPRRRREDIAAQRANRWKPKRRPTNP